MEFKTAWLRQQNIPNNFCIDYKIMPFVTAFATSNQNQIKKITINDLTKIKLFSFDHQQSKYNKIFLIKKITKFKLLELLTV
jgi:hypothetical protein